MPPTNLISPLLWMSLAFEDKDAFMDFMLQHETWHRTLAASTTFTGTKLPPANPILTLALDDLRENSSYHQAMHDEMADALKIPRGGDLSSVNFDDRDEFQNWHFTHAQDHQRLRLAAGL